MMILIRVELVSHKNEDLFFIKWMFCFSFLHHLENYGPWIVLYCMLSIPKGQNENKWTVWLHVIPKNEKKNCYTIKYVNV